MMIPLAYSPSSSTYSGIPVAISIRIENIFICLFIPINQTTNRPLNPAINLSICQSIYTCT